MKKLTIILTGIFLVISASVFAAPAVKVSETIKANFNKDFVSSSDVIWEKKQDLYVASFNASEHSMAAAYNEEGQLLSVSRNLDIEQLPIGVSMAIKNLYSDYTIKPTIVELFSEGNTSYFIDAENNKHKVRLQSDATGNIRVVSKTKKK